MKYLYKITFRIFILLLLFIYGCQRDDGLLANNTSDNIPAITNVYNTFSFVVYADDYNYSKVHQLDIHSDTIVVTITISGHSSGNGVLEIKDGVNASLYLKDLSSEMVVTDIFKSINMLGSLALSLNHYTGKVTITVAGKVSHGVL